MRRIVRTADGWGVLDADLVVNTKHTLAEMVNGAPIEPVGEPRSASLLAPIDEQEVWAAGVTYQRSLTARAEESQEPDVYERVYSAQRPEVFFKSLGSRVVGPNGSACIRSDSRWDVPEPELVLVLRADGRIFGYTIGDDVSSRSIEGANPLYLPQAKVYDSSCVIGPWIVPADDVQPPFPIELTIEREGATAFEGATSTENMARAFDDLASWLTRAVRFESGVLLMTGTGIVPPDSFTLQGGDIVRIHIEGIGTLEHGIGVLSCGPPAE